MYKNNESFEFITLSIKTNVLDVVFEKAYEYLSYLLSDELPLMNKVCSGFAENVFKQVIFEISFFEYSKNANTRTMYSYVKERRGISETVDDDTKKKYLRSFSKLDKHQNCVLKSFGIDTENIDKLNMHTSKPHYVSEHQEIQYEIMNEIKTLAYKLSERKFKENHNYSDEKAEEDLKQIEVAYDIINQSKLSYFHKCIQYYYLETQYHIETMYMFFKAAKEVKRPLKLLKKDISLFKRLLGDVNGIDDTANHIITGIDILVEIYKKYPDKLERLMGFIHEINILRKYIVRQFKVNSCSMDDWIMSNEAEIFFKNYIGLGQHIVRNKDYYNDIDIKYFRKIY